MLSAFLLGVVVTIGVVLFIKELDGRTVTSTEHALPGHSQPFKLAGPVTKIEMSSYRGDTTTYWYGRMNQAEWDTYALSFPDIFVLENTGETSHQNLLDRVLGDERSDLVDETYHTYSFRNGDLGAYWFAKDEIIVVQHLLFAED